jgi:dihydrofolate synthase / folylpolyglutamate synthase
VRFSCLSDWLRWQEQHHPNAIDLGLARVRTVAERLGLLARDDNRTVITVAGTNGKGSTVATLASVLCDANLSVGTYTSPHLQRYNERIGVNGKEADDVLICQAFAAIDAQAQDISLTYFEFGTLAALWIFKQQKLRYWVLEVGLGGRLDAVNIIDADVAIVTSIALDHQDWLGTDLASIGREKAGIFRPAKPAIYMDAKPQASVLEVARDIGANVLLAGRDFHVTAAPDQCQLHWRQSSLTFPRPALPLTSVVAALVAAQLLALPVTQQWLQRLPELGVAGRFQRLTLDGRQWLLDVAHNPAACAYFIERVQALPGSRGRVHALVAMMADKDLHGSLAPLVGRVDTWYFADLPGNARAARAQQLADCIAPAPSHLCATVAEALARVHRESQEGDSIWVLGSFFTVAAALPWLAAQGAA